MWEIKLQNTSLSLFSREEFSLAETPTGFPKIPINILVQKGIWESQVWPLRVKIHLCGRNKSLVWLDSLRRDSETSPSVHTQSRRVHIKPAKSEEDNWKNKQTNKQKRVFQVLLPHQGQTKTPTCLFYGPITKNGHLFFFSCMSKAETGAVPAEKRPSSMWMKKLHKGFLIMKATRASLTLKWGWLSTSRICSLSIYCHISPDKETVQQ